MPAAPLPPTEASRLLALHSYDVLDTACESAFDELTRIAAKLIGTPIALVSLVDADRQWFKARHGVDATETPRSMAFCAHAILDPHRQLVVPNAPEDPRFADNPLVTGDPGIRAYAGTPLVNMDGHALGTLCVIDTVPRPFTEDQLDTLRALAHAVQTTLELRRALRQVRQMALTDALTGMANRRAFLRALGMAIARLRRRREAFTLLYLDLDGFKRVNDLQGHAAGDAVLRGVAEVLAAETRQEDTAARIGGDEFALLLDCCATGAPLAAERVRQAINQRMDADGWAVTASIGAVSFVVPPRDEAEAMNAADELMYAAKGAGKNRALHRVFIRSEAPAAAPPMIARQDRSRVMETLGQP